VSDVVAGALVGSAVSYWVFDNVSNIASAQGSEWSFSGRDAQSSHPVVGSSGWHLVPMISGSALGFGVNTTF
jgi:hypothetical protein